MREPHPRNHLSKINSIRREFWPAGFAAQEASVRGAKTTHGTKDQSSREVRISDYAGKRNRNGSSASLNSLFWLYELTAAAAA